MIDIQILQSIQKYQQGNRSAYIETEMLVADFRPHERGRVIKALYELEKVGAIEVCPENKYSYRILASHYNVDEENFTEVNSNRVFTYLIPSSL